MSQATRSFSKRGSSVRRILRRKPSPAMLIALIALFVSMGGVSYGLATGSVDSRELKNNSIRSKDIRNSQVRSGDIRDGSVAGRDVAADTLTGLHIDEGELGTVRRAATAGNATTADTATTAGTAEPRAFARVEQNGSIPPALAKNLTSANVTHPSTGVYCFTVPFDPRSAVATAEVAGSIPVIAQARVGQSPSPLNSCPAGTELEVNTLDPSLAPQTFLNGSFYVQLN